MYEDNKKLSMLVSGGILIALIAAIMLSANFYAKRGVQGRLSASSDSLSLAKTQYEPYYMEAEQEYWGDAPQTYEGGEAKDKMAVSRKLIRRADISLKVKDSEKASQQVLAVVNSFQGIIIDSRLNKFSDDAKNGRAQFKVLPKYFDAVLAKLREIGTVESEQITGEDVTEQYVDLQARLENFRRVRERLLRILEEKAYAVKDILEVERELSRVGEQIETIEGKLKYLDRQVNLSTITVSYYEKGVIIFRSLEFMEKFKTAIRTSMEVFIGVFNGIIVIIGALLPIAMWLGIIIGGIVGVRKLIQKK